MSPDAPSPHGRIDYAPPVPARRRFVRRWGAPVVVLGVILSAYFWLPPLSNRAQTVYWQHRCLAYRAPADAIVVDVTLVPGDSSTNAAGVVPEEWARFYGLLSAPGLRSGGTAFLHELRSSDGARALVAVDFISAGMSSHRGAANTEFHVRLLDVPGGGRTAVIGRDVFRFPRLAGTESPRGVARLQIFAGQPDETDPSHFTIRYRYGQSEGVIDGWLRQDTIELEPRDATTQPTTSLTPPPPPSPARSPAPARPAATRPARPPAGG